MATNKFATMLHRNTNKITVVLVYAILEWILIILLLLNSLFSYLIMKFVDYFGLKRPCIWCTRIDHIIEPENNQCSCWDLVCEAHAFEISKLGFCLNHRKLAEAQNMCENCSSSCQPEFVNLPQSFGHFPWMQQKGMTHGADGNNKVLENGMEPLRCSCCGDNFVSKFYLIRDKPSSRVLDSTQKENLITESEVEAEVDEGHHNSDYGIDDFVVLEPLEEEQNTVEKRGSDIVFYAAEGSGRGGKEEDDMSICFVQEDVILDFDLNSSAESEPVIENCYTPLHTVSVSSSLECRKAFKTNGIELTPRRIRAKKLESIVEEENLEQNCQEVKLAPTIEDSRMNGNVDANMKGRDEELSSVVPKVFEDATLMRDDELGEEVSTQNQDFILKFNEEVQEISSCSTTTFTVQDDSENLHKPHKMLILLERKESETEVSLEVSSICDTECGELTIEKLKSALKAERKALNSLYDELEEERSASAVAANQTMAMINRLQEEKAAMRMEALQYERMMEERCEYDQEALQLLNELLIKREKEKVELEKELEIYRKKVHEYEVRETMIVPTRESNIRSITSPPCSNARDSDQHELPIDKSRYTSQENVVYSHQEEFRSQSTYEDGVIYLEESLENLEEERLLILEHLNMLQKKLVILNYEEEYFDGIKSEHICEENANANEGGSCSGEIPSFQALEADKGFLKHCIIFLRKGDKDLDLIQEILQHLRDHRNVELRIMNIGETPV
ncbi:myosin-binding protein 2-like [Vigna umbellata]|uniref:myosin-binding protein 2-like n=1 Tax=Vigna umbellata TaxID=87088 RepID=UPI001F5FCAF3|nr:myosin-binding protein 2-like [Vigna umbellata]